MEPSDLCFEVGTAGVCHRCKQKVASVKLARCGSESRSVLLLFVSVLRRGGK